MAPAVRPEEVRAELAVSPQKKERQADRGEREDPTETVVVPQVRMGTRFSDMPGARMRRKVTTKFAEPTVVEIPRKIIPSA